jgi:ATP-binding cassette, subfamily C (CFTR/MRP), member 1
VPEIPTSPPTDATDRRTGDRTVYKYYARTVGIWNAIIFVALCASFVFALIFPQYLVRWWTDENALSPNRNMAYYLGGYAGLGVLGIGSLALACWHLVAHMMPRASTEFHDALLDTTWNAQFSLFTEIDIGTTTNRFSQDLQLIDMELPLSLFNTTVGKYHYLDLYTLRELIICEGVINCVAQFTMIAISAKYIGAVLPALLVAFFILQKFYLRTARQLRLLDIEAKAPLFSKFWKPSKAL